MSLNLGRNQTYGFLDLHSGYFLHVAHVANEVNVLGTGVETLPVADRKKMLLESEEKKWDEEYYMYVDFDPFSQCVTTSGWITCTTRRSRAYSSGNFPSTRANSARTNNSRS